MKREGTQKAHKIGCFVPLVFRYVPFVFLLHSRVGSSSGSGVACAGRIASGTCLKLTRMRVHVDDLPRIESTRISSTASSAATSACFFFHRSRPATAASLFGEFATTISGILDRARDGATRGASPSI